MPDVLAELEYLQKLKLYETEKPYHVLLSPDENWDYEKQRLDNLYLVMARLRILVPIFPVVLTWRISNSPGAGRIAGS
jgi:hypothetical protein